MIVHMYALKDIRTAFKAPATFENEAEAKRNFEMLIKNEEMMRDYKTDFELWEVGVYDTNTGIVTPNVQGPKYIMGGKDC